MIKAETVKPVLVADEEPHWGYTMEQLATAPMAFREDLFADQVVLITGGGGGFGRAMAFMFARLGAQVIVSGRKPEKLEKTAEGVARLLGKEISTVSMNIRRPGDCDALIDHAWERYGRLDLLVNNAGGQYPQAAIDFSTKGWLAVIDTNLNGTWYMMQAAARRWRDAKVPGSIVNIVANVWRGMPQVAHTCAARAGVIYLSKTLSTEWAPFNVRVNCVSPGSINSDGLNVYEPSAAVQFKNSNPMRRFGHVYDVGQAVAYVGGSAGSFTTGAVIVVDGGNAQWGDVWPAGKPEYFTV